MQGITLIKCPTTHKERQIWGTFAKNIAFFTLSLYFHRYIFKVCSFSPYESIIFKTCQGPAKIDYKVEQHRMTEILQISI